MSAVQPFSIDLLVPEPCMLVPRLAFCAVFHVRELFVPSYYTHIYMLNPIDGLVLVLHLVVTQACSVVTLAGIEKVDLDMFYSGVGQLIDVC